MDLKFRFRTRVYIVASLMVLFTISISLHFFSVDIILDSFLDINYFDLLLGQIANTLIVLSLTSVLSSNFGQAYWVDIKDSKLIYPFWGCFIGITVYLLTGMAYSLISYALGFKAGVVVSSIGATILLIILTFKMISIYFGKDELKKQLRIKYKKLLILNNTPYVTDYVRRLKKLEQVLEKEEFPGKNRFLKKVKKEIAEIESRLDSGDEIIVDKTHKEHVDKYIKGIEQLQAIDLKIEEYTKNAIDNNDSEVVRENIELLVDSENYGTFFDLLEELFDWDEKYACRTLLELSRKNMAWVIKDRMSFFKQYALSKLISESGKLDALQNLLLIYDVTNLGMKKLDAEIKKITDRCRELKQKELQLNKSSMAEEDFRKAIREQRDEKNKIKAEYKDLKEKLVEILIKASTKDLRSFYVPIKEAIVAYVEGKYDIVNKYLTIILTNFEQDKFMIKSSSGIAEFDSEIAFQFSYVTDEEIFLINQLIEKDKKILAIPENIKIKLSNLDKVVINNNAWSDINPDSLEIFRSTMDLPKEE